MLKTRIGEMDKKFDYEMEMKPNKKHYRCLLGWVDKVREELFLADVPVWWRC